MKNDVDSAEQGSQEQPANWSGVFAMSLCAFIMIAGEFLPVSLLTPMAAELNMSEGAIGRGISMSGVFAVIVALTISSVAGNVNRKKLLMFLTGVMLLSCAIVAAATNYYSYLVGRALVGVALGGFWSMSASAAMRMVPANKVPKALAILNGGNALALVVAAPLGSLLGALISWRGAFFVLIPVTLLAFIWQWVSLPSMVSHHQGRKLHHIFKPLKSTQVVVGFFGTAFLFMGQFTLYTYVRPFLEIETGVNDNMLTIILLTIGVAGFIGTSVIGYALKGSVYYTLMAMPVMLASCALLLIMFGSNLNVVFVVLFVWGFIATAAPVGWWTWVSQTMPDDAESGGGLMVAIVQLSIGTGSTVGGILFDHWGYESAFAVSGVILVMSGVMALISMNPGRRVIPAS